MVFVHRVLAEPFRESAGGGTGTVARTSRIGVIPHGGAGLRSFESGVRRDPDAVGISKVFPSS